MKSRAVMEAIDKVIAYADSLGLNASRAVWDEDDPEWPRQSLEEMADGDYDQKTAQVGVFFEPRVHFKMIDVVESDDLAVEFTDEQPGNGAEQQPTAWALASQFNALSDREKWDTWKNYKGVWYCKHCSTVMDDGPEMAGPRGGRILCGECDGELTHRTPGGQSDPFNWVLKPCS